MEDSKLRAKISHSNTKHHSDLVMSSIDPTFIARIEDSPTASLNYMRAFKDAYKQELDKSTYYHDEKKRKELQFAKLIHKNLQNPSSSKSHLQNSYSSSQLQLSRVLKHSNTQNVLESGSQNASYLDYDEIKGNHINNFTYKNYDGGDSFFRSQDAYIKNRCAQNILARDTVDIQLCEKEQQRQKEKKETLQLRAAMDQMDYHNRVKNAEEASMKSMIGQKFRQYMINDIEGHKIKRKEEEIKNRLPKGAQIRHNPITNPIQYHIDNPYILRRIQGNLPRA